MLKEFKLNCVMMTGDGQVQEAQSISFDFGKDVLVIPLYDNDERHNPEVAKQQEIDRRKTQEQKKNAKYKKYKNPTRAMKKRELQQLIEEEEEWEI